MLTVSLVTVHFWSVTRANSVVLVAELANSMTT